MSVTLGRTELRDYELHLSDGDAVVRNRMINAWINAKLQGISPEYRGILATPVFSGNSFRDERIQWQSDQFASEQPRPLSELSGEERQRYEEILHRAVDEYTRSCRNASPGIRKVLEQALTYHSDEKVFCGDGKVVITEWGMHPKDRPQYEYMTMDIDLPGSEFDNLTQEQTQDQNQNPSQNNQEGQNDNGNHAEDNSSSNSNPNDSSNDSEGNQPSSSDNGTTSDVNQTGNNRSGIEDVDFGFDNITTNDNPEPGNLSIDNHNPNPNPNNNNSTTPSDNGNHNTPDINININGGNGPVPPSGNGGGGVPPYGPNGGGDINGGNNGYGPSGNYGGGGGGLPPFGGAGVNVPRRRRPWWKWLLWLLLALLVLFIVFFLLRACQPDPMRSVLPVAPEITEDDISLSEDSVNMEVNNRLILLIAHGGTVPEFVKDFRKKYPDTKKYILSNPDTLIPRVVLTLPKEEKPVFKEKIQSDFPAWDIVIIPDAIYSGSTKTVNDPALSDSKKRWYFDMTDVFDAWDVTMGNEDLVVAVIDDGFDLNHPELQGKIVMPYNAVTHDSNVFPSASGHGTHVAATAVGNANNREGTAGIAPNCKLMPIQVADRNGVMTNSSILDGVLYAIYNGADVVNMSLGMYFNPLLQFAPVPVQKNMRANNFLEEEKLWNKVFDLAEERGVSFVIAGGNQNILVGLDPMQRSENTIKVSAVQPDKYKASFSNYGDYSVVSAPGVDIYNAVPGNQYTFMEGTSMASPIVAGGVALIKSNDPSLSTSEIATLLRETGIPSPSDVGPIVNFGRALKGEVSNPTVDEDCDSYQRRYNELLEELERLKREHPRCVAPPDTLTIPEDAKVEDFRGTWKSTTPLYNDQDQEVVIYFTFNGTSTGSMQYVEPDGAVYTSPLNVRVEDGKIYMSQIENAGSSTGRGFYERYDFVLTPGKDRKASGRGQHRSKASNVINFQLIRLNR